MDKVLTACCALCQITCGNDTTTEELQGMIDQLKKEADEKDHLGTPNEIGQRACFVITTPNEGELETKLKQLGFSPTYGFNRRKGYEPGRLFMWMLQW